MSDADFKLLGISKQANKDEIKNAYQKLAKIHHPDKSTGNTEMFQKLQSAYERITKPPERPNIVIMPFHPVHIFTPNMFGPSGFGPSGLGTHFYSMKRQTVPPTASSNPSFVSKKIEIIMKDGKRIRKITENSNGSSREYFEEM